MHHMKARLRRDVPVCLLDFSLSGCRVATNHSVEPGSIGHLRISVEGNAYQDTIRIVRTTEHKGSTHTLTLCGRLV